ncbi:hypothetical protein HT031_005276 [Scenedesmus sp. PABB004]|nr:hypothetical protein HT031_005276 [Scenedesmus sp. PABB004]
MVPGEPGPGRPVLVPMEGCWAGTPRGGSPSPAYGLSAPQAARPAGAQQQPGGAARNPFAAMPRELRNNQLRSNLAAVAGAFNNNNASAPQQQPGGAAPAPQPPRAPAAAAPQPAYAWAGGGGGGGPQVLSYPPTYAAPQQPGCGGGSATALPLLAAPAARPDYADAAPYGAYVPGAGSQSVLALVAHHVAPAGGYGGGGGRGGAFYSDPLPYLASDAGVPHPAQRQAGAQLQAQLPSACLPLAPGLAAPGVLAMPGGGGGGDAHMSNVQQLLQRQHALVAMEQAVQQQLLQLLPDA